MTLKKRCENGWPVPPGPWRNVLDPRMHHDDLLVTSRENLSSRLATSNVQLTTRIEASLDFILPRERITKALLDQTAQMPRHAILCCSHTVYLVTRALLYRIIRQYLSGLKTDIIFLQSDIFVYELS